MNEENDKIVELQQRLDLLLQRQHIFVQEVRDLRDELNRLKAEKTFSSPDINVRTQATKESSGTSAPTPETTVITGERKLSRDVNHKVIGGVCSGIGNYLGIDKIIVRILWFLLLLFYGAGGLLYIILWIALPSNKRKVVPYQSPKNTALRPDAAIQDELAPPKIERPTSTQAPSPLLNINWEKFIGENLINKIGILITVIGVGIGAKYSIDNDLISPLTRIILGYLVGVALLGIGFKLKAKYENYSAVLVSGAMAIFYFITFIAYSFYALFPQTMAFALMVVFTIFTVIAALNYNNQIIAHIGLVGAYAVPFLLSDGSGRVEILLTYMAIINLGILVLSFKKYWKSLFYASFVFTWLIFISWYNTKFDMEAHFSLAFSFLVLFFLLFYATFIAYKIIKKEQFKLDDILLLLANSFIFFGLGYSLLESHPNGSELLGLFTLCNAVVHFAVSTIIYRQKLADRNMFYLVVGLVLVFITIAVPIQLDGNWVTLLWVGEAALLFWIGKTKQVLVYESLSYPLMILAFLSLMQDWEAMRYISEDGLAENAIAPLLNIYFANALLFIAAFVFINLLNNSEKYPASTSINPELQRLIKYCIQGILLIVVFYSFSIEIQCFWNQRIEANEALLMNDDIYYLAENLIRDQRGFKMIWLINYAMLFGTLLAVLNLKKLANQKLGFVNIGIIGLSIFWFLTQGLLELSELRESYLNEEINILYTPSSFYIGLRYVSFVFVSLALVSAWRYLKRTEYAFKDSKIILSLFIHVTVLWIASSELINLLNLAGSQSQYKLGLSILWGIYSLFLIILGLWKKQKHLRIAAISLFGITLVKLFFYDLASLSTISKTIVLVSLGVLLLIISFLYNKYKSQIDDEVEN